MTTNVTSDAYRVTDEETHNAGMRFIFPASILLVACSSPARSPDAPPPLRPGVVDSSQAYQGTPDTNESAFWTAVRDADDPGRAAAVQLMAADVHGDPTNGYSAFLIGANAFMAPSSTLRALADGTAAQPSQPDPAAVPYLKQGLTSLTDPFYLGFDGGLLATMELASGDTADGGPTFATAATHNPVATTFMKVLGDLAQNDPATALADISALLDLCNGAPVDRDGADADAYVAKMNAGTLVHRECYSGYFAPHGSSGELFIIAELNAVNGNTAAAAAYYAAIQKTSDYATWPLKPLVQRRLAGAPPDVATLATVAGTCGSCHTDRLP